jgi:hypothetical protein
MKVNDHPRDCCTGSSPCPRKPAPELPGTVVSDGGVFCLHCFSKLNKQTPKKCPECGKDLTK